MDYLGLSLSQLLRPFEVGKAVERMPLRILSGVDAKVDQVV